MGDWGAVRLVLGLGQMLADLVTADDADLLT
jgi:hypothetical protein